MIYIHAEYNGAEYTLVPLEDIPLRIDVSTIENGEIGEVFGDISQDIQFAASEENNRFFNHAFEIGRQDVPGTFRAIDVRVENGHTTLMFGQMTVSDWDDEIYTCQIQSGTIPLDEALGEQLIADADWSALDHTYSMNTWRDQNSVSDSFPPYFYPFMDLGFDEDGRPKKPNDVVLLTNSQLERQIDLHEDAKTEFGFRTVRKLQKQLEESYDEYGHPLYATDLSPRYEIIVGPSQYFGDVSFSSTAIEGTITSPVTPFRVDQLGSPAVKAKEVVDRIFEQAGATYSSTAFPMLEDLYIYPNLKEGLGIEGASAPTDNGFRARDLQGSSTSLPIGRLGVQDQVNTTENEAYYRFGGDSFGNAGVTGQTTVYDFEGHGLNSDGEFVVPEDGPYEFNFKGSVNLTDVQFNGSIEFLSHRANIRLIKLDGTVGNVLESHEFEDITRDTANNAEFPFDITYSGTLFTGQRVIAELECTRRRANKSQIVRGNLVEPEFSTNSTPLNWEGQNVDIGAQFQDTKSKDLLQGIMQKLNMVPVKDKNRKNHYNFEQYNDWILSAPRVDWSDRVSNIQVKPLIVEQDSQVIFTDAESDDIFNTASVDSLDKVYGTFTYPDDSDDTGSEETSGDRTIGDFFSPVIVGQPRLAGDPNNIVNVNTQNGFPHLYDAEELASVASGIHMGYSKAIDLPSRFYYSTDSNAPIAYSGSVRTLSNTNDASNADTNYANIGWNYSTNTIDYNNAYNRYWKQYIDHLYDPNARKITCDVYLTPEEYIDFQGNETIHINGNDYLINSISGYNLSEPDTVEAELITYQNNFTTVFTPMVSRYVEDPGVTRTFTLGIKVTSLGDDGEPIDAALLQDTYLISKEGLPATTLTDGEAETVTQTLIITPSVDYDVSASNFTSNAADLDGVQLTSFRDIGRNVEVDITCTIQDFHVFHTLDIRGEVDPIVGINNTVDITYTTSGTGSADAIITNTQRSITNNPTAVIPIQVIIGTASGKQLDEFGLENPTLTITTPGATTVAADVVSTAGYSQLGTSVLWEGVITIPSESVQMTVDFNIPASNVTDIGDLETQTLTVNFSEQPGGIQNVSLGTTQIVATGVVGTTSNYSLILEPASGYMVEANAASIDETSDRISMYDAVQVGPAAYIPVTLNFGNTSIETVNVTVQSADGVSFDAETVDYTISFTNQIYESGTTTLRAEFTELSETVSLPAGYSFPYTNTITATPGYNLDASSVTAPGWDITDAGTDTVNIHRIIEVPTGGGTLSTTVTGNVGLEPYLATVDLVEDIAESKLSRYSFTERFDYQEQLSQFTVRLSPVDTTYSYSSRDDVTAAFTTGAGVHDPTAKTLNSDGSISFTFRPTTPTVIGDASYTITFTQSNDPLPGPDSVTVETVNEAVANNMDTSVMTHPVSFETGGSFQPYVYQYIDGDGQTRVGQIFTPDIVTICVAGDTQAESLANASWQSNPSGDGTITTGPGSCNIGTINSDSVNGVMLQVSSTAPSAGTASNVITFVTG